MTAETEGLLACLDETIAHVVEQVTADVFGHSDSVLSVVIRYVVLQLLSDASFCLNRWQKKGGGAYRKRELSKRLHKWLWRALWDFYVSSHVCTVFEEILKK